MKSIQGKFVTLSLVSILLSTLVVGGFGIWFTARTQREASDQILALTCREEANELDMQLSGIETAVMSSADLVENGLPSVESLSDDEFLESYLVHTEEMMASLARNTFGVCTFYLRLDPSLSKPLAGFLYTRQDRHEQFRQEKLTDIEAFDSTDTERVGWFYQPRDAGKPIWMDPYYNKNLGINMVSFVSPLYKDKTFVGVVGIDINFNVIMGMVRNIKPYKSSRAFLVSKDGIVQFHPDFEQGTSISDKLPELKQVVTNLKHITLGETPRTSTYTISGAKRKLTYCLLKNGMVLMLSADTSEINAPVYNLVHIVAVFALAFSAVAALVVVQVSKRISKPLVQLVDVADRIANGDLDVELPEAGDDEVGILSRSLEITVGSLRSYIGDMSTIAYRDALTSVKNKAAYNQATARLDEELTCGDDNFGLLVVDINDLKMINDVYGHRHGDDYLRTCCQMVCHVFEHSPVFRVGGDEFVVLLEHGDLEGIDELLAQLEERMARSMDEQEPWERVSMAKGFARSQDGDTKTEDVFHRADVAMYSDKRRMKAK